MNATIQYAFTILAQVILLPMWLKSYYNTEPEGTFLSHLVCHRTLTKNPGQIILHVQKFEDYLLKLEEQNYHF